MAGGWKKYFDDDLEKAFDDWIENTHSWCEIGVFFYLPVRRWQIHQTVVLLTHSL